MGASAYTIDSNLSGLAFAAEVLGSPGVLPATPIWYGVDPNSYKDFGGSTKITKRETINSSRQERKGVLSGIDVKPGFQLDFLGSNLYGILPGFMFAAWREKPTFSTAVGSINPAISAVTTSQYTVASGGGAVLTDYILFASGFNQAANNGLKFPTAAAATSITVAGLAVEASPPVGARIVAVGLVGASGDLTLTVSAGSGADNDSVVLGSTVLNFTTLPLIPGEWLWLGGDAAGTHFATAANAGFYRIKTIAANALTFDRYPPSIATDSGAAVTLQVFWGQVIKNEAVYSSQVFQTYALERQLNSTNVETMMGCGANKLELNVKMNDKVTCDLEFVGLNTVQSTSPNSGTRVAVNLFDTGFSAATDFPRLRLIDDTAGSDLTTYVTDVKLSIDNQLSVDDAIRNKLGGIDLTAGNFMVSATAEAYFSTVSAITSVQNNDDVGLDFAMVRDINGTAQGWLFDVPYNTMSDAKVKVERDKPTKLPLSAGGAADPTFNHTLLVVRYNYLPQAAL